MFPPLLLLAVIIAVSMVRSFTVNTLRQAFVPIWYHQLGYQPWFYGSLATTVVCAGRATARGGAA